LEFGVGDFPRVPLVRRKIGSCDGAEFLVFGSNPTGNGDELSLFIGNRLTSGTILTIDDDFVSLDLMQDLLTMSGYRVFTASEGQEGMDLFEHHRPDLVISDIQMPNVDGHELLRKVRAVDDTVPVILVTGHGDLDNALLALRRGAYDFLLKPINADILMNTVRKALESCRLRRFERNYRHVLEERVEERTKELARTNEFLQGILNSSTRVAIILTDLEHNVMFWNTGAETIYGYPSDEMLGTSVLKLFPVEEGTVESLGTLSHFMHSKAGTVQENIGQVARDGRQIVVSMAVSPSFDASGQVRGILILGQDVTKEVRLHEALLTSYRKIQKMQAASIFALAKLAESRDGETAYHLKRLQAYSRVLCVKLASKDRYRNLMTNQFIEDLVQCSVLHDIGKVAIPDTILFNPKKFGVDEFAIMKQHAIHGGRALQEAADESGEPESFLTLGKDVAYYHHERWDGKGYPFGLKGEKIPLAARIVALADVYDALTTERRYKKAFSHDEARSVIGKERGKQFDPDLVDTFLEVEGEFRQVRDMISSSLSNGRGVGVGF